MHFHGAAHVLNAPKLDEDSDEKIVEFKDQYVSCHIPDENEDKLLHDLVSKLQVHHHTRTCHIHDA